MKIFMMLKFTQTLRPKSINIHTHKQIHMNTQTSAHAFTHKHTHKTTHIYTQLHTQAHTYTNLYIYEYNIVPSSKGMVINFIHEGCSYVVAQRPSV